MAGSTYSRQEEARYTLQLNKMLDALPRFLVEYFNSLEFTKQPRTKIAYAYDLDTFFDFLVQNNRSPLYGMDKAFLRLSDLDKVTSEDISDFLRYCKAYDNNGKIVTNSDSAIKRKLCSVRGMYKYFYRMDKIKRNPSTQVNMPVIHEHNIVRLEANEVAELLDNVESGAKLTKHQAKVQKKLAVRDLALLTLLLGTGIRVSECVGLDITDVDFDNDRIRIIRKGGAESFVYFGNEVREALIDYANERKDKTPLKGHENAFFLSRQNKRLGVRSIEILVKKYAGTVTNIKKITPHKLRSTYGTNLYQESRDIYLVADVLGHKDVNTTRRHYADMVDENKRKARNIVKLRKED